MASPCPRPTGVYVQFAAHNSDGAVLTKIVEAIRHTPACGVTVTVWADTVDADIDFSRLPHGLHFEFPAREPRLLLDRKTMRWVDGDNTPTVRLREKWHRFKSDHDNLSALATAGAADAAQETPVGRFLHHQTLFDPRVLNLVSKWTLSS